MIDDNQEQFKPSTNESTPEQTKMNLGTSENEVEKFSSEEPDGLSNKKVNPSEAKKRPNIARKNITFNAANASKIEKLDRFSRRTITVGFYTKTAAALMESQTRKKGSKVIRKMGLDAFDRKFKIIDNGSRDDNPIADTLMYEIEHLINIAGKEINIMIQQMQALTERFFSGHNAGLSYDQDYAYSFEADWKNSISFKVMWLIKEADICFNQINIAAKAAIITEQTGNFNRQQIKTKLLNILHYSNRYKHSNVTRKDFAFMTPLAKKCIVESGENIMLRSDVLMLTKRAECAPTISARPNGRLDDIQDALQEFKQMLEHQEDQELHKSTPAELKKAFN